MHHANEVDTSGAGSGRLLNRQLEFRRTFARVEAINFDTTVLILLGFYCFSSTKIASDTPVHIRALEAPMNCLDLLRQMTIVLRVLVMRIASAQLWQNPECDPPASIMLSGYQSSSRPRSSQLSAQDSGLSTVPSSSWTRVPIASTGIISVSAPRWKIKRP